MSALSTALTSRIAWDRVFREFSLVLPDDVWLTTLTAKSPISPLTNVRRRTGAAPSQFTIQGRTYSHDGVARLLSRLQVVPDLTNVQLAQLDAVEGRRTRTSSSSRSRPTSRSPELRAHEDDTIVKRFKALDSRALIGIIVGACLVVGLAGWFLLVRPQGAKVKA